MTMTNRRAFLAAGLAAATLPGVGPGAQLFAAPAAGQQRLLLVFLRGAFDGLSLLAPVKNGFYQEARPRIALSQASGSGAGEKGGVMLADGWALHPAMAAHLMPFWRAGTLALVPFAGSSNGSRSHFETQDFIEFGLAEGFRQRSSGFLARLAQTLEGAEPLSFTRQPPIIFRGPLKVPNISLAGGGAGGWIPPALEPALLRMYERDAMLGRQVRQSFEVRREVSASIAQEMEMSGRGAVTVNGFSRVALRIARMMRERVTMGFVDVAGWDTHGNQMPTLDTAFDGLGRGLAGFAAAMGSKAWAQTTVVVMSEFGRTVRENGAKGTDHGRGTMMMVMGGSVRGGRILGEQTDLAPAKLADGRDLPVLNEYNAVLGGLFQRLYGLDAARAARIFPTVAPRDIGLV